MYSQRGKIRIPPYVFILLLAVILGGYLFSGGLAGVNARALAHAVEAIPEETTQVSLNELVPFEWDEVYTFDPYTSEEEIKRIIRLDSGAVEESVSEGMVQLVFVEWGKERVVASVCAYPDNLGYDIRIPFNHGDEGYGVLRYEDNAVFSKSTENGVTVLTYLP